MQLICSNCGASASLPLGMSCRDHRPVLVPERIQLRRTKGYRKPEGAIIVARPSKWGNPFRVKGLIIMLRRARRLRQAGITGPQLNEADVAAQRSFGAALRCQDVA